LINLLLPDNGHIYYNNAVFVVFLFALLSIVFTMHSNLPRFVYTVFESAAWTACVLFLPICIRSDNKISWVIYFVVPIQWAHAIVVVVTVIIIIISPPHVVVFIKEELLSLEETISVLLVRSVGSLSSTLYLLIILSVLGEKKITHK